MHFETLRLVVKVIQHLLVCSGQPPLRIWHLHRNRLLQRQFVSAVVRTAPKINEQFGHQTITNKNFSLLCNLDSIHFQLQAKYKVNFKMGINHTKYLVLMSLMTQYDSKTMNQFTTIEFYDNLASGDALIT